MRINQNRVSNVLPPTRFEIVRLDKPLESILQQPQVLPYSKQTRSDEVVAFTRVNQQTQERRNEFLTLALTAHNEESKRNAREGFEKYLLKEGKQLTELMLARDKSEVILPGIVQNFKGVLDKETEGFLISAESVARFAKKHLKYLPVHFDFSVAGCGLWKAIERELNLSFIWYLRRYFHIVENEPFKALLYTESPLKPLKAHKEDKGVKLYKIEAGSTDQLQGIELGGIHYLLNSAEYISAVQSIKEVLDSELSSYILGKGENDLCPQIKQITDIRNNYAHIKAMPYSEYERLHSLVLSTDKNLGQQCFLAKVLELKKVLFACWKQEHLIA